MAALLSLALLLSPRAVKALNTFSRRSRRMELFRNGSTEERDSVTIALPSIPRSPAAALAAAMKLSGRPSRSASPSSMNQSCSSPSKWWLNEVPRCASRSLISAIRFLAASSSPAPARWKRV
jgi:hypothetical protein